MTRERWKAAGTVSDELEALRDELDAIIREKEIHTTDRSHRDDELDALHRELIRLQCERDRCRSLPPQVNCETDSMGTAPMPPYPPFPPFPPYPPYAPFPPFPPYPPNCGCCAPSPCGCAKCGGHARPAPAPPERRPAPEPERPRETSSSSSSSSLQSSSSTFIGRPSRPIGIKMPSSSSSIFSTNVR